MYWPDSVAARTRAFTSSSITTCESGIFLPVVIASPPQEMSPAKRHLDPAPLPCRTLGSLDHREGGRARNSVRGLRRRPPGSARLEKRPKLGKERLFPRRGKDVHFAFVGLPNPLPVLGVGMSIEFHPVRVGQEIACDGPLGPDHMEVSPGLGGETRSLDQG